jgi:hypothetical protein
MKTKQNKIDRSGAKWLPGAMAIAATTASSQAATVQITLTGNMFSTGGNTLEADLTGDDVDDISFGGFNAIVPAGNFFVAGNFFDLYGNAGTLRAQYNGGQFFAKPNFLAGGVGSAGFNASPTITSARYLNPIHFTDTSINGGLTTFAWLEVHAFNESTTSHTVQLTRLIFDDASTTRPAFASIPGTQTEFGAIPEPSSFALLGLGAAGVLARRRRQAA